MLSKEVLRKIRLIEIETRRLLSGSFVGDHSSAKKGSGFEFDQIRDYQFGDDVRSIDWKSSARSNKILVKQYVEERNRTIILAVDVSASSFFSSAEILKIDVLAQVAAALALVADYCKDRASLILFTDEIEVFLPAASGKRHVHKIMEQLFSFKPKSKKTNINCVFDLLVKINKRDSIVFILSDFIDDMHMLEHKIRLASRMYDLVAIRCLDEKENSFDSIGFINIEDIETGESFLLDTRSSKANELNEFLFSRAHHDQASIFKKFGIDLLDLSLEKSATGRSFISDTILFFRRRMIY